MNPRGVVYIGLTSRYFFRHFPSFLPFFISQFGRCQMAMTAFPLIRCKYATVAYIRRCALSALFSKIPKVRGFRVDYNLVEDDLYVLDILGLELKLNLTLIPSRCNLD